MPSATLLSYTYNQQKAIFWAGKPTDVLGMIGSVYLCYCITKDSDGLKKKVFRRLFLALAIAHIVLVCIHILGSIPTPEGSFYGSLGNKASCSAIGFLSHVAYTMTMVYNGSIGIYYYIVFTYNWSDQTIKQKAEPVFHGIAAVYPLLGPILGLAFGMYNADPLLLQCWASPAPLGCGEVDGVECERGHRFRGLFVWLTGFVELNVGTVIKLGAVVKIMVTVLLQQRRNKRRFKQSVVMGGAPSQHALQQHSFHSGRNVDAPKKKKIKRTTLAQETCWQSFWFLLSCFIPYFIGLLVKMVDLYWVRIPDDRKAPGWLFTLALISNILFPIQGIFNTLIFLRPSYMRRRRTHAEKGEGAWESAKVTLYTAAGFQYKGSNPNALRSTAVTNNETTIQSRASVSVTGRGGLTGRFAASVRKIGKSLASEASSHHQRNSLGMSESSNIKATAATTTTEGNRTDETYHMRTGESSHERRPDDEESKESFAEDNNEGSDELPPRTADDAESTGAAPHVDDDEEANRRVSSFKDEPSLELKSGQFVAADVHVDAEAEEAAKQRQSIDSQFQNERDDDEESDESSVAADGHLSGMLDVDDELEQDENVVDVEVAESTVPSSGHLSGTL